MQTADTGPTRAAVCIQKATSGSVRDGRDGVPVEGQRVPGVAHLDDQIVGLAEQVLAGAVARELVGSAYRCAQSMCSRSHIRWMLPHRMLWISAPASQALPSF